MNKYGSILRLAYLSAQCAKNGMKVLYWCFL